MIGAELADRVSPVSALRPELLLPDGSQDCYACGMPFTACSHPTDFEAPETTFADWVRTQVAEKASQQTVKRGPGRPPKARTETEAAPAPETPVVAPETPVAPAVAPPAPEVAPVGPAPTETAPVVADAVPSTADAPPVPVAAAAPVAAEPPMVRPPGPAPSVIGADYGMPGVQTLSPVAPDVADVPRVAAASVDVGGAQTVTDVVETPPGFMSPDSDPHRPNAVLVNDPADIWATGAWMRLPGSTTAAITMEVQQVFYSNSMRQPLYRMLFAQGSVIPLPMNLQV